ALEQLLYIYLPTLERFVEPRIPADIRGQIGTDDLVQEILAQAFRDFHSYQYRDEVGFLPWLRAIAEHRLVDTIKHIRRKKRGGDHHQLSAADLAKTSAIATLIDLVGHDSHAPDKSAARREAEQAIQVALAGLPEDQREAIRRNCLQGND